MVLSLACKPKRPPVPPPSTVSTSPSGTPGPTLEPIVVDPAAPAPELELRMEPPRVSPGESATMSWESRHADRVIIDHDIGPVPPSGRIKLFPEKTTSYQVSAVGPGGRVDGIATVEIAAVGAGDIMQEDLTIPLPERFVTFVKPVFFDFDSAELNVEARLTLDGNLRWLERDDNRNLQILIEGHCDARGTEEYNLALGERRAQAVKSYLRQHGLNPARISTVSLGEERPFAVGDSESDHALNRRAHFVLIEGLE